MKTSAGPVSEQLQESISLHPKSTVIITTTDIIISQIFCIIVNTTYQHHNLELNVRSRILAHIFSYKERAVDNNPVHKSNQAVHLNFTSQIAQNLIKSITN